MVLTSYLREVVQRPTMYVLPVNNARRLQLIKIQNIEMSRPGSYGNYMRQGTTGQTYCLGWKNSGFVIFFSKEY